MCWENEADVVVQLANGDIYALRHQLAWKLELVEGKFLLNKEKGELSSKIFPNLPSDISLAFTIPTDKNSSQSILGDTHGYTFFLKPPIYYFYKDREFLGNDSFVHWEPMMFLDNRFVMTTHKSAVVMVSKSGYIPDGIKGIIGGQSFMFDTHKYPARVGPFEILPQMERKIPWFKLKQMIPLVKRKPLYLAVFHEPIKGMHYCVLKMTDTEVERCHYKTLASAFKCEERIVTFRHTNWLISLWNTTGISLHRSIWFCIGGLLGTLWVNVFLFLITLETFIKFYKKYVM